MSLLALAFCSLSQEEHPVPRAQKDQYVKAIAAYEKAVGLLEKDPAGAVALLDPILGNADLKKRDCRLKIETHPGTYEKYDFYPHQCRGRARMKMAQGAERDAARRHLEGAIRDFEDSKKCGLPGNDDDLREARTQLEALRKGTEVKPDPEAPFSKQLLQLLKDRRFRSALEHIEKNGSFLTPERRRKYVDDARQDWEKALQDSVDDFLRTLQVIRTIGNLVVVLPDPSRDLEPPGPTPQLDWCARVRADFARLQRGEDVLADLWDRAIEALTVFAEGECRGFECLERIAYDAVASRIEPWIREAREAGSRERVLHAEALRDRWTAFEDRVKKAARKDVPDRGRIAALTATLSRFPVDEAPMDPEELERSAVADHPEEALQVLERKLDKQLDRWDGLTLRSRRELWTHRAAAAALRGLLQEKSVEQIVADLGDWAAKGRAVGGPSALPRLGPKVERVFQALR